MEPLRLRLLLFFAPAGAAGVGGWGSSALQQTITIKIWRFYMRILAFLLIQFGFEIFGIGSGLKLTDMARAQVFPEWWMLPTDKVFMFWLIQLPFNIGHMGLTWGFLFLQDSPGWESTSILSAGATVTSLIAAQLLFQKGYRLPNSAMMFVGAILFVAGAVLFISGDSQFENHR